MAPFEFAPPALFPPRPCADSLAAVVFLIDFLEESDDITVHLHKSLQAWDTLLRSLQVPQPQTTLRYLATACLQSPYLTPSIQQLISIP